jgi:crossover junction endodeoxyribonuclease RuvC
METEEDIALIIGLDLSLTSTGISVYNVEDDDITTFTVKTRPTSIMLARYETILSAIRDTDHFVTPRTRYFIEGYSIGSFAKSTAMTNLIELGGIVRFQLYKGGREYVDVPPTVLKKFVTGKGNGKKEDMKLGLYKKYRREFPNSDEADAFALMLMGMGYLNIESEVIKTNFTKAERSCINSLRKE